MTLLVTFCCEIEIYSNFQTDTSSEEKRKQHQKELALQLNEQARQRMSEQSSGKESTKVRKSNVSYKHHDQIPNEPDIKELKIYVGKYSSQKTLLFTWTC